jgi:hypothetical protein
MLLCQFGNIPLILCQFGIMSVCNRNLNIITLSIYLYPIYNDILTL